MIGPVGFSIGLGCSGVLHDVLLAGFSLFQVDVPLGFVLGLDGFVGLGLLKLGLVGFVLGLLNPDGFVLNPLLGLLKLGLVGFVLGLLKLGLVGFVLGLLNPDGFVLGLLKLGVVGFVLGLLNPDGFVLNPLLGLLLFCPKATPPTKIPISKIATNLFTSSLLRLRFPSELTVI